MVDALTRQVEYMDLDGYDSQLSEEKLLENDNSDASFVEGGRAEEEEPLLQYYQEEYFEAETGKKAKKVKVWFFLLCRQKNVIVTYNIKKLHLIHKYHKKRHLKLDKKKSNNKRLAFWYG
jgi:hypothetical protein